MIKLEQRLLNAVDSKYDDNRVLIKKLIKKGVNPSLIINKSSGQYITKGYSPLMVCARHNNHHNLSALIENGADINYHSEEKYGGQTALMVAAGSGSFECPDLLLKKGADVDQINWNGMTALAINIFQAGDQRIIKALVEQGADINHQDFDHQTILHWAIQKSVPANNSMRDRQINMVTYLCGCGVDYTVPGKHGETALELAQSLGRSHLIEPLTAYHEKNC